MNYLKSAMEGLPGKGATPGSAHPAQKSRHDNVSGRVQNVAPALITIEKPAPMITQHAPRLDENYKRRDRANNSDSTQTNTIGDPMYNKRRRGNCFLEVYAKKKLSTTTSPPWSNQQDESTGQSGTPFNKSICIDLC